MARATERLHRRRRRCTRWKPKTKTKTWSSSEIALASTYPCRSYPFSSNPSLFFFLMCFNSLPLFSSFSCRIVWSKAIAAGKNAKWVRPFFNLFEVAVKCHPELRWIEWRSVCFWLSGAMLQILWSGAWQWGLWWNKKPERCNLFIRFCKMWWHSEPA